MTRTFHPGQLDVAFFAEQAASLQAQETGSTALAQFPRLAVGVTGGLPGAADASPALAVRWQARGQIRAAPGEVREVWLHVDASASVPQTCQRCLQPVAMELAFERAYRFVPTEADAERDDAEAEEDLLVISRQFNLLELVEDELLMELPLVARHDECPVDLPMMAKTADFVDETVEQGDGAEPIKPAKPNPFAVLASLKLPRG